MTDFSKILEKAKEVEAKMKESKEKIKQIEVIGVSGGDAVKVTINGEGEMINLDLSDEVMKEENVIIRKVNLESQNDDSILKKELVYQIYSFSEKKVVVIADIGLSESYLIYVDKIENTSINQNSDDYRKYYDLSKVEITNSLYKTYDSYLKDKYKININYKAFDNIKNNFKWI